MAEAELRAQLEQLQQRYEELLQQGKQDQQPEKQPEQQLEHQAEQQHHVDRVNLRLPPFWPENPGVWFAQVEAQFALGKITSDNSRFNYLVSQLDQRSAAEVQDIIIKPPTAGKYDRLKAELMCRILPSQEDRIRQFTQAEIGDRRPSQFLRYLRNLVNSEIIPDSLLRTLWSGRLPSHVQSIIAAQINTPLEAVAELADKVFEVIPQHSTAAVSTASSTVSESLDSLGRQIAALDARFKRLSSPHNRPSIRSRKLQYNQNISHSHSNENNESGLCWYHRRFHSKARRCIAPCSYKHNSPNLLNSQQ